MYKRNKIQFKKKIERKHGPGLETIKDRAKRDFRARFITQPNSI